MCDQSPLKGMPSLRSKSTEDRCLIAAALQVSRLGPSLDLSNQKIPRRNGHPEGGFGWCLGIHDYAHRGLPSTISLIRRVATPTAPAKTFWLMPVGPDTSQAVLRQDADSGSRICSASYALCSSRFGVILQATALLQMSMQ